jgi:hypothetical protein
VLTTKQLHPWRHPAPFDFHYSEMWRQSLTQQLTSGQLESGPLTDPDLAAHTTTLRARPGGAGRPDPRGRPGRCRRPTLARRSLPTWSGAASTAPVSMVCSTPAGYWPGSPARGWLSKAEAALWAFEHLPAAYRATITKARSAYGRGRDEPCSPQEVRALAHWALAQAAKGHSGDEELIPAWAAHRASPRLTG